MSYPTFAISYFDVQDPTKSHGMPLDSLQNAFVLNQQQKDGEVTIINLGDVVPRVYFSSEPTSDSAMPFQVKQWAVKLRAAAGSVRRELQNLQELARSGKLAREGDAFEDPDVCRLAIAAGQVREFVKLLSEVGRRNNVDVSSLEPLASNPILILDIPRVTKLLPIADSIADLA